MEASQRVRGDRGDDRGLGVARRTEVEGDVPPDELGAKARVVDRARAVGDPFWLEAQGGPDLRGATPLPGVEGDPQAASSGSFEGTPMEEGIGEALLRTGQVEAGQAGVSETSRGLGHGHVRLGIVRAHRGADEPDRCPGPSRRL